ncbi:MAG: hypothetical protein D6732_28710 [Methanobacteriota archaeon]|nr:MAG: hypothetical protein D6732_28710 [Euryarchaeota archaeon]
MTGDQIEHADTIYQNMPKEYTCNNCSAKVTAPMHCGHPMHIEEVEGTEKWVCWMGTGCGVKEYQKCCNSPALVAA